ncbi:6119_t:CDS:1, partial [Dentiscutata heterogama]
FHKVLAISQLRGILTQNYQIQELDKLKRLYESASTTALLDYSEDMFDTSSTTSTNEEDSCLEFEDENNKDIVSLWLSDLNENEYDNLLDLELTNINKLLDKKHLVKDHQAKWPLNKLFLADLEAPFFVTNI